MVFVIICITLTALIVILATMHFEKVDFNDGLCPKCNHRYRLINGLCGREYKCDNCGRKIWVTYPNIDKNRG